MAKRDESLCESCKYYRSAQQGMRQWCEKGKWTMQSDKPLNECIIPIETCKDFKKSLLHNN